jgi:N6-L-threonylcarbamoyladenine synthase
MKILSIETSCDETAAAVVEDGRTVLSSVVYTQIEDHKKFGGVVPEVASRKHVENITDVCQTAIDKAKICMKDIDAVAVTSCPGLIGALLVGVNFAKGIAYSLKKPLIPVNHIYSHIAANYITNPELRPPFLCLVVSGGHTQIIEVEDYTKFKVLGTTRDDAVGEVYDKIARVLGLGYPGGAKIDAHAKLGNTNSFKFPHPKISANKSFDYSKPNGTYDFSFSGLKTAVVNLIHKLDQNKFEINIDNIAASFQKTVIDILCEKFMQVAKDKGYTNLALAGGVSANSQLRERLIRESKDRSLRLYMPELKYCGDNAAMVGVQAYYEFKSGNQANMDLNASSSIINY